MQTASAALVNTAKHYVDIPSIRPLRMSRFSPEYSDVKAALIDCYIAHEHGKKREIGRANTALRKAERVYKAAWPTYDLVY